jgi:hypothetical protein
MTLRNRSSLLPKQAWMGEPGGGPPCSLPGGRRTGTESGDFGDFGDLGIGLDRAACLHTDELFAWKGARLVRFQLGNEGGGLRTPA